MSDRPAENPDEQPTPAWQRVHISWYAVVVVGFLVYECTSQPGLAAAVTCAKFGWADWRAAVWLRRVDPDQRRGQTCFWFYLAFGLWKVAVLATAMMLILLVLGSAGDPKQPPGRRADELSPAVIGVLVAAGFGFGLSFLLTYVALWCAFRHRVKVWLGAAPRHARVERYWPPCRGDQNAAAFVTMTALILTLWFAVLGIALAGNALGPGPAAFTLLAVLALASPLSMILLKYLEHRIFARSPAECWPLEDVGVVYQLDPESSDVKVESSYY